MASTAAALALAVATTSPALVVSGGGLDFANLDITASPDFANGNFKGKDFTQGAYGSGIQTESDKKKRWFCCYFNHKDE